MSRQKIGEASVILAVGTVFSNLLQIGKLILISKLFGAGVGILDPYFIAMRVPLAVQGVIMGTLQMSFIPVYVGHITRGEKEQGERVLASTLSFGLVMYALLCLVMALFAEPILRPLAPNFSGESFATLVSLFYILLGMLFLNGVSELLSAFYNGNQRYFLPAIAPAVGLLVSVIYLIVFPEQGVYNLAYGLVLGGACQVGILVWGSVTGRAGFRLRASKPVSRDCVPVYRMMLPVAGGLLLANSNQLIDVGVAARLGTGAVAILEYATRLHDVIMRLFVASIGGALLPFLSQYVAEGRAGELRATLSYGMRLGLLVLLPAAAIITFFGAESISAMFQSGRFTATDAVEVGKVWAAYAIGLLVIAETVFKGRALVAVGDLRPLWLTVAFCIPLNIALDIYFAKLVGVSGIALATAVLYLIYLLVYDWRLRLYYRKNNAPAPVQSPLIRTIAAIAVAWAAAGVLRLAADPLVEVVAAPDLMRRATSLGVIAACVAAVGGIYLGVLKLLKVEEAAMLLRFGKRLLRIGGA